MSTDKYESIIDVSYLGQRDVDKYISDLRRLGAITEQVERQLRAATSGGLGGSSDDLGRALGVGAARMRDYDAGAAKAIANTERLTAATSRLRAEVARLNEDLRQASSGMGVSQHGGFGNVRFQDLRRGLYRTLESSAVNQRIATQSGAPLTPIGRDGLPAPLALPAGTGVEEAQRARLAAESRAALLAELRAREQATAAIRAAIPMGPGRQPLALPAGGAQIDPLEAARVRAATERARREEALLAARAARGQEAIGSSFGAGGRLTGLTFDQGLDPASREAADEFDRLTTQIRALRDTISEDQRKFSETQRNRTAAGQAAEEANRAALQARITDAERRSAGGQNVNGFPDVLPDGNSQLYRYGRANIDVLRQLGTPEARNFLIGREGAGGDPLVDYADQLKYKRDGIPVPGLTSRDQVLQERAGEFTSQAQERLDGLLKERVQIIEQLIAAERRSVTEARARAGSGLADENPLREPIALGRGPREQAATEAAQAEAARVEAARREEAAARARAESQARAEREATARAEQITAAKAAGAGNVPPPPRPPTTGGSGGDGFDGSGDPRIQAAIDNIAARERAAAGSRVDQARAGVVGADSQLDGVLARLEKGFGQEGGFKDQEEFNAAYAAAVKRGAAAQERLNAEIQQEINRRLTTGQAYANAVSEAARAAAAGSGETLAQTAQRKLETAQLRQVDVNAKAEIPVGTPGGYRTDAAREAGVRAAETAVQTANRGLVAALEAEKKAHEKAAADTRAAAERYTAAFNQAGAAGRQATAAAASAGGPPTKPPTQSGSGSFFDDFRKGFVGEKNSASYAEQVGQTFKFSVLYGTAYKILTGITETLQQTLQEGIAFQQGMTDLSIATGRVKDALGGIAESAGAAAVAAGQAPSVGVQIAARAQGLYGTAAGSGATIDDQARIARIAAEVVSQEALISGLDPADIQTQLAAVTNAFGLGIEGLRQVGDLDAYLTKQFGAPAGSTIQTVAESGNVAAAAGYSLEEATSIAALVQAKTGQTSSAVAGFLAQIFSREGEAQFGDLAQRYGADPTSTLSDKIEVLAEAYRQGSPNDRSEISGAFGRGKVQNAVVALLANYDQVESKSAMARQNAGGELGTIANLRIGDIGGQIQETIGVLKDAASALSESGVLDLLGAGLLVIREFVEATTTLLRVWNQMPDAVRGVLASLALLAVATRTTAGRQLIGAAGDVVGTSVMRSASASGGVGALRGAATSGIAVGAVAVGLTILSAKLLDLSKGIDAANDSAEQALLGGLAVDASPDQVRARASELRATAADIPKQYEGFGAIGIIKDLGGAYQESQANYADLLTEAKRLDAVAAAKEAAASSADPSRTLITGFDAESLSTSLDLVTRTGGTATDQFKALAAAISGGGDQAARVAETFRPNLFAGDAAAGTSDALQSSFKLFGTGDVGYGEILSSMFLAKDFSSIGKIEKDENIAPGLVRDAINPSEIQKRLTEQLQGVTDLTSLSPKDLEEIAAGVIQDLPSQVLEGTDANTPENIAAVREEMIAAVTDFLQGEADALAGLATDPVSQSDLVGLIQTIQQTTAAVRASQANTDFDGKLQSSRAQLKQVLAAVARTGGPATSNSLQAISDARIQLAQDQIAKLEALRAVAQRNAENEQQFKEIGRDFLSREIDKAVAGGDRDSLATLIEQGGKVALDLAREAIKNAIATARAAMTYFATAASFRGQLSELDNPDFAGSQPGNNVQVGSPEQRDKLKQLQGLKDALTTTAPALPGESSFLNTDRFDSSEEAEKDKETALERQAALAAALAVRSESPIDQARASILGAKAALAKADKGTVEYYNALGELYGAQSDLTDAVLQYKQNQYLLGIDLTDPLEQAKAELKAAEDKLRSDAGKGGDVLAEDRLAVQNAQNSLESTKFQQRLETVQDADRLGRISHGAYIRYLENEQRRLESIKNRTYQQQQQLNDIDGLLQDAAKEMQGQFNLGNINLPTPYEVRRYVEQSSGAMSARAIASTSVQSSETTIYIDGADTAKVRRIVEDVTGQKARTTTSAPRRR